MVRCDKSYVFLFGARDIVQHNERGWPIVHEECAEYLKL